MKLGELMAVAEENVYVEIKKPEIKTHLYKGKLVMLPMDLLMEEVAYFEVDKHMGDTYAGMFITVK